ncbi:hypothetical protein PL81_23480 [Streptomyces sp. RSD-27]|nr:hypothetical protein PL81_23480 [Streptomyces sp. RSD-27]
MDERGGALERAAADGHVVEGWLGGLAGDQALPVDVLARPLEFARCRCPASGQTPESYRADLHLRASMTRIKRLAKATY